MTENSTLNYQQRFVFELAKDVFEWAIYPQIKDPHFVEFLKKCFEAPETNHSKAFCDFELTIADKNLYPERIWEYTSAVFHAATAHQANFSYIPDEEQKFLSLMPILTIEIGKACASFLTIKKQEEILRQQFPEAKNMEESFSFESSFYHNQGMPFVYPVLLRKIHTIIKPKEVLRVE